MFSPSCGSDEIEVSYSAAADANTLAAARTSAGHRIAISLDLAPPPAESHARVYFPDGGVTETVIAYEARILPNADVIATVIAAHGGSVLVEVSLIDIHAYRSQTDDYFVYDAAADPPRPPSLSLLPPCYHTEPDNQGSLERRVPSMSLLPPCYYGAREPKPERRVLDGTCTGLVRRRGENGDEIVVAELKAVVGSRETPATAELVQFRSGEWSVVRPAFSGDELTRWGGTHGVVPAGDGGMLCFFNLHGGLMLCDVFDERSPPKLLYVPLPAGGAATSPPNGGTGTSRNVCATAGGRKVKFVNIFPRCCCGGAGATKCRHSYRAFTIATWTLDIVDGNGDGKMAWAMDAVVDAAELWALDAYRSVARVQPTHPVVSLDEPHVVSFVVSERYIDAHGDHMTWLVMLDTRSKTVLSVCPRPDGVFRFIGQPMLPSRVSHYFNTQFPSSSICLETMSQTEDAIASNNTTAQSSSRSSSISSIMPKQLLKAASPAMMFAALEDIPSLAREDMLKVYRILCHDSTGRRFESLLGLPMSLRKEWALLEIKATEACYVCSACAADN
ncbi:hypothetical protein EJB05_29107, partial [Eragrostis curvula]